MYDFTTLSPYDFEHLVRDLLEAEHGWRLTAFASGPDGGVDLRGGSGKNKIVVQCKHYARSSPAQLKRSLAAERSKMAAEKPGRYLVATSRELAKAQHDAAATVVTPPLAAPDDLLHRPDLNSMLARHPKVERHHFKLWLASSEVLAAIVHSGIWARSEALLEDIQSRVRLYVQHDGYQRAEAILKRRKVVVISGSPGVGKSMLAEMLLLTHWKDGWQVVQVGSDIEDAWKAWAPQGKQIFLYDDFLGQTNAGERLSKNEDAGIVRFADLVSKRTDKRFVLTTRTQVLRQAEETREPLRRASFDVRNCVIAMPDYDRFSRARIIYNHLYFSDLPRPVIREYASAEAFWAALEHPNFSPRVVEQVLRRPHTTSSGLADELAQALSRPVELWGPSFEHGLSDLARELLLTLVSFPPEGVSREELLAACAQKASSLPTNQAFRALEGTWVRLTGSGAKITVAFADPSCRDYVLAFLDDHPDEAARLLLSANSVDQAVLLLRYASSGIVRGGRVRAAHPGLRSAIKERNADVLAHLDGLYPQAVATAADYRPLERLLDSVLGAKKMLGAAGTAWVDNQIVELAGLTLPSHGRAADALARLILHLAGRHKVCRSAARRERLARSIASLSLALAHEAETESEFETYGLVASDALAGPLIDPAAANVLAGQVAAYVRQQVADLDQDYQDPEDMRDQIGELTRLAREHGAESHVSWELAAAERRIDEQESYSPNEDESPDDAARAFTTPAGGTYTTAVDRRSQQNDMIRALFRNLT